MKFLYVILVLNTGLAFEAMALDKVIQKSGVSVCWKKLGYEETYANPGNLSLQQAVEYVDEMNEKKLHLLHWISNNGDCIKPEERKLNRVTMIKIRTTGSKKQPYR